MSVQKTWVTPALFLGLVLGADSLRAGHARRSSLLRAGRPADPQGALLPVPRRGGEAEGRARPAAGPLDARKGATRARRSCPASTTRACSGSGSRPTRCPRARRSSRPARRPTIAAWIDQGAPTARPEPARLHARPGPDRGGDGRSGRSSRSAGPSRPGSAGRAPVRTPIDAFLLARLEDDGLAFSPEADRRDPDPPRHVRPDRPAADARGGRSVPRRRPRPTPTSGWSTACSPRPSTASAGPGTGSTSPATPTATATPRKDPVRPYAYKYRDYVIRALNADRPWDELIREQLAGDEMVAPPYANLDARRRRTARSPPASCGWRPTAPATGGRPDRGAERGGRRHDQDRLDLAAGPDRRLRPVPRPPLRPDPAGGLLPLPRHLRAGARPAALADRRGSGWSRSGSDADRATAAEVDAEVKADRRRSGRRRSTELVAAGPRAGAGRGARGPARRSSARPARRPRPSGPPEQKQLLKAYPRVNVSAGQRQPLRRQGAHRTIDGRVRQAGRRRPGEPAGRGLRARP